jgi:hypothetical protein
MPRDAVLSPAACGTRGGARRRWPWLPGRFALGLLLGGLLTGLLTLGGASLLEGSPTAGGASLLGCIRFQVGSDKSADAHILLENYGAGAINLSVDIDQTPDIVPWSINYRRAMEPWASQEIMFRAPAPGASVQLLSPGKNLIAFAEIHRDDGVKELRHASLCIPGQPGTPAEIVQ